MSMNIYELHEKITAHLFPTYSNSDEHFLALALCGEAGELANLIKKRWRDDADLSDEVRDEIADCRVYLELLAKCYDIEGPKLDRASAGHWYWSSSSPKITSCDEHTMPVILCKEVGRLADYIVLENWTVGAKAQLPIVRICIEAFAKMFDIEGSKLDERVKAKLEKVAEKHKARLG